MADIHFIAALQYRDTDSKFSLEDLADLVPLRNIVLVKEITKMFEEYIRGKIEDVLQICKNRDLKGEYVLIIAPKES